MTPASRPPTAAPAGPPRRRWRRRAAILLALTGGLLAFAWTGLSFDAGLLREPLAASIARTLGRPVSIDGDARLHLSLRPSAELSRLRIGNPPGFDGPDLAVLGAARLELDLLPLLRRVLVVRDFSARDLQVRLVRRADGLGNWQRTDIRATPAPASPPSRAAASAPGTAPGAPDDAAAVGSAVAALRLERVLLERIELRMVDPRGHERSFDLDRLEATGSGESPLSIRVVGRVDESFPYSMRIDGGPLARLSSPDAQWPFALALSFAGTDLRLDGAVRGLLAPGETGMHTDLSVSLRTADLSQLERLLQTRFPPVGATRLAFRLRQAPGTVAIEAISGAMGATTLDGQLHVDTRGARPRISGELTLPTLDLRPFLGRPETTQAPRSLLDTWRELSRTTVDLARLRDLDADVTLAVGQWLSLPGEARDAKLGLRLGGGRLHTPVEATLAGARLTGEFLADASGTRPHMRLRLGTVDSPLGALGALLTGLEGLDGRVGRLAVQLEGRGATVGDIARDLSARLEVEAAELTYGNLEGGRPVQLRLDRLEVAKPSGRGVSGQARGALLSEPFTARLEGSDLGTLAHEGRARFDLQADASGARASLAGEWSGLGAGEAKNHALSLRFALGAPRAGRVGRWLGLSPDASVPLDLRGRVDTRADRTDLHDLLLTLGSLHATGEASREGAPGSPHHRLQARLKVQSLDVDELRSLLPPSPPRAPGAGFEAALRLPLLPREVPLVDAEVDLALARARVGPVQVDDLHLRARLHDGRIAPTPLAFTLASVPFTGQLSANLRGPLPDLRLQLSTRQLDAGALLARLGVAEGQHARIDDVEAEASLRGSTLSELLAHSSVHAQLRGGEWAPRSHTGAVLARLALERGTLAVAPGAPLLVRLAAAIDRTPVEVQMRSATLEQFARPGAALPFALSATALDSRLDLEGLAQAPMGRGAARLTLRASGPRLDRLDPLARVALPPWGPWSLDAQLSAAAGGYRLDSLAVTRGSTRLQGSGELDLAAARPRIRFELRAPVLDLDDFPIGEWQATHRSPRAPAGATKVTARPDEKTATHALEEAAAAAREGQRLLSRSALMRQDARVRVSVDEVRSGSDRLGRGEVSIHLDSARLRVDPVRVALPGGEARIAVDYEPLPGDVDARVDARVRIDRFDYGVLARRLRPDAHAHGRFSVHADLVSTAPLDRLLAQGDGRIDVAVWPVDLMAGLFDLWAVNVFVAMLPALDPAAASRINCAVGHFDLRAGLLREELMVVDSTRLRARGRASVDLRNGSLALRMQPRPKQAQFFSLQTPVEVSGRVDDFRIGLPDGSIPATVARFLGSLVTTPIEWLLRDPLPADGADVCTGAMRPTAPSVTSFR